MAETGAKALTDSDRWDGGLPDIVWSVRAGLHTRVSWAGPLSATVHGDYGDLDGPAVLGPLAGWLMRCSVGPVAHGGFRAGTTL